jgi:PHD/YefM family antitoxin component YafN of YafNO toxin-antitoxin module
METHMVKLTDIHPLTGFLRDHKEHIERLAATGRPEVLTINGKARVVVQDAAAYQKMVDALDAVETERIVRERLSSLDRNEAGVPADQVLTDVRKRLGIKRK